MTVSTALPHVTRDERTVCLREAIRRRVERQRAEKLRELQDALSTTCTDGMPGIRRTTATR